MSVSVYPGLPSTTSIRLFHLAPGTLHEPVVGTLDVVDLENKPDYECVSYTWGDAGDEEEISVDGEKSFHSSTLMGSSSPDAPVCSASRALD